ncbi:MAG: hypothetical protein V2A72_07030 [Candidatus Omnitrophota bacterium]
MRKILTIISLVAIISTSNPAILQSGVCTEYVINSNPTIERIFMLLRDAAPSDLSFCLGYIRDSSHTSNEIAGFIKTWSADAYIRKIPSKFRSKIDRIVKKLRHVDYQQLIIDIDLIKNSHLTVADMIKLINGTNFSKKR